MNALTATDDKPTHDEVIRVLENSLYPGAKRESIELVLAYCRTNGLDPMLRPVYIVPTSVKKPDGTWETRDVLMPGIADYRIKAARSGEYGGKSEPEFGPDVRETLAGVAITYPAWCRITVRRIVQGQAREFVATERWLENYATAKRDTQAPNAMWKKRPYGQLAKVAEAQALRMAFPEFSAGFTMEEMQGKTGQDDDWSGPTIEGTREAPQPPSSPRDALNAQIPLRSAAAATPRAPRKADPEVYEAAPDLRWDNPTTAKPGPERKSWSQWAEALELADRDSKDTATIGRIIAKSEIAEIVRLAQEGEPSPAKTRIVAAFRNLEARYLADPPQPPDADDLDEVAIAGEERLAAG
jgi:phage recombination protein Bet